MTEDFQLVVALENKDGLTQGRVYAVVAIERGNYGVRLTVLDNSGDEATWTSDFFTRYLGGMEDEIEDMEKTLNALFAAREAIMTYDVQSEAHTTSPLLEEALKQIDQAISLNAYNPDSL